jgi:nanoRNase/pAp phosphatase (c-di-AMP/oligoRNAs hydrolase)
VLSLPANHINACAQYRHGRHLADVTEIYREVAARRRQTLAKMVGSLLGFVYTVYSLVHVIVVGLITPSGRAAARTILQEAAAALHRRR